MEKEDKRIVGAFKEKVGMKLKLLIHGKFLK